MQNFPKNHSCTIHDSTEMLTRLNTSQSRRVGTWRIVVAMMFRSIARVGGSCWHPVCFRSCARGQRPNLAEPAQSDRGAESADDDAIDFPQQYAGQDHEVGGSDARVEVQLPADEGCSLVCRDPELTWGIYPTYCVQTSRVKRPPPWLPRRVRRPRLWPTSKAHSTTAMACTPGSPMRTSMTRRISLASRRTRCSF